MPITLNPALESHGYLRQNRAGNHPYKTATTPATAMAAAAKLPSPCAGAMAAPDAGELAPEPDAVEPVPEPVRLAGVGFAVEAVKPVMEPAAAPVADVTAVIVHEQLEL